MFVAFVRVSKKLMPPTFYFTLRYTRETFIELHYNFSAVSIFISSHFSHPNKSTYSCLGKSLSVTTDTWDSEVPCHLHNNVLAGCLSKEQTGKNLVV
jgi:hypothetical protein